VGTSFVKVPLAVFVNFAPHCRYNIDQSGRDAHGTTQHPAEGIVGDRLAPPTLSFSSGRLKVARRDISGAQGLKGASINY
jgi:hypothetical protein